MPNDPSADELRITVRGRPVVTTRQAARQYGITEAAMRGELSRMRTAGNPAGQPALLSDGTEPISSRTPVYWEDLLMEAKRDRPGQGGPGKPRRKADTQPATPAVP